ncbi:MAG: single-stranded-DNA-specific exonuclease RecJ [Patescibacteria group bacterium]
MSDAGIITGKKWALKESLPEDAINIFPGEDRVSSSLLFSRGIKSAADKANFFSPDYEKDLHDPFLLRDMEKAATRIIKAIRGGERIVVFGDYDADGVCGATIFSDLFVQIGYANFRVYIPDRYKEGYGLSAVAVEAIIKENPAVVITVDCGVTNFDEVERLNSLGIDAIIIDHHIVPPRWPNAFAIIDAKKETETYPFKFLCGAGMAFKTVKAILRKDNFDLPEGWEKWLLDVAAIATVADMVPLLDENRALVHFGLKVLRKTRRVGLTVLFKKLRIDGEHLTAEDVAFSVAPYINAASRMGNDTTSFELLTTDSYEKAHWLVDRMVSTKTEQAHFVDLVLRDIRAKYPEGSPVPDVIIMGDASWHPGVLGITANRVLEMYSRPVFLWGQGEESETVKGSARSRGEISVVEIMRNVQEGFFLDFGGHHAAGGFSLATDKAGQFEKAIAEAAKKAPRQPGAGEDMLADAELAISDVGRELLGGLDRFEPFGMENPKPVFWLKNLALKHVGVFGKDGLHLKLSFHNLSGGELNAIAFWRGKDAKFFEQGEGLLVDLLANVEMSRFNGTEELRLRAVDYKIN